VAGKLVHLSSPRRRFFLAKVPSRVGRCVRRGGGGVRRRAAAAWRRNGNCQEEVDKVAASFDRLRSG